jgi:hypothetical protein
MNVALPSWPRRRRAWVIAAGVVAVLVAGAWALTSAVQRVRVAAGRTADL